MSIPQFGKTMAFILAFSAVSLFSLINTANAEPEPKTVVQVENMHEPGPDGAVLPGAGILTRSKGGVHVSLHMTELDKQSAYTAWWIIFNDPEECTFPCGLDDLIAGIGQGFYATGFVTGTDGNANVYAWLSEGSVPEGADRLSTFFGFPEESGLDDAFKAEIHLIPARSHGMLENGEVAEQIGSFDGLCGSAPDFPNCEDQQAIAFEAPN